jgi:hypothetical protein
MRKATREKRQKLPLNLLDALGFEKDSICGALGKFGCLFPAQARRVEQICRHLTQWGGTTLDC